MCTGVTGCNINWCTQLKWHVLLPLLSQLLSICWTSGDTSVACFLRPKTWWILLCPGCESFHVVSHSLTSQQHSRLRSENVEIGDGSQQRLVLLQQFLVLFVSNIKVLEMIRKHSLVKTETGPSTVLLFLFRNKRFTNSCKAHPHKRESQHMVSETLASRPELNTFHVVAEWHSQPITAFA